VYSGEREEFDRLLGQLCAGFNVPVGDRAEAYWKGLARMSLVEFARCVEFALGEQGPEKIPTSPQVWGIRKQLRTHREIRPPEPCIAPLRHYTDSQRFANQLLVDWLSWYCRSAGTWIPEEMARALYVSARELADQMQLLRDDNDPSCTGQRFLREFCDRVLAQVSVEMGQRYHAHVMRQQRTRCSTGGRT
jgi:hypothetical protein